MISVMSVLLFGSGKRNEMWPAEKIGHCTEHQKSVYLSNGKKMLWVRWFLPHTYLLQ